MASKNIMTSQLLAIEFISQGEVVTILNMAKPLKLRDNHKSHFLILKAEFNLGNHKSRIDLINGNYLVYSCNIF